MRTAITKIKSALAAGDTKSAQELFKKAEAEISRAGTRNIIHRKNASRKVSRLASLIAQSSKKK